MKSVVMYGSRYGNTERVARAIADGLRVYGEVELTAVTEAPVTLAGADLVVIGGPTEAHGDTPAVEGFLDDLHTGALDGMHAAAFDTRLDWPRWLSGSAGAAITNRLNKLGADVVAPPASFVVEGKVPQLKPGELDRASAWGDTLGRAVIAEVPALRQR